MRLAMAAASTPPKLLLLCGTFRPDDFQVQRQRASHPRRPASCSCSSSPSSYSSSIPPQEAAATRQKERQTSSSSSSSSDFANFKPPPPARPVTPKDLAIDLPFQYWYSYADLPPGVLKRRPKINPGALTIKSDANSDAPPSFEKDRSSGGLWRAALAVESGKNCDPPNLGRRPGEAAKRFLSTEPEKGLIEEAAPAGQEEDEDTPLSEKEVKEMVLSCVGSSRHISIGWQGWTPNCAELMHLYWKRTRVCKLKCKGVVTLDMDAMCKTLEADTGGKVIHQRGGAVYVYRGKNYKHWRDAQRITPRSQPIAPRLPKRLPPPCNLTKEEVNALRARGRELLALCKLGTNGVYLTLLDDIRRAFESQDLVRVNCQGFHPRNFKSLASKLKVLVPCELVSFEFEHILMWRSKDKNYSKEEVAEIQSEETGLFHGAL